MSSTMAPYTQSSRRLKTMWLTSVLLKATTHVGIGADVDLGCRFQPRLPAAQFDLAGRPPDATWVSATPRLPRRGAAAAHSVGRI